MLFYHATNVGNIECFDNKHSKKNLDLGNGLYTTIRKNQAYEWANKKQKNGFSYIYVSNVEIKDLNILMYKNNKDDYIQSFYLCRYGAESVNEEVIKNYSNIDLICGPMLANVKEFSEAIKELHGDYIIKNANQNKKVINTYEELIEKIILLDEEKYGQSCFKSNRAINLFNEGLSRKIILNYINGTVEEKFDNIKFEKNSQKIILKDNK